MCKLPIPFSVVICYSMPVVTPNPTTERGVYRLDLMISFLVSVMAGVTSYYICKWLDGNNSDN